MGRPLASPDAASGYVIGLLLFVIGWWIVYRALRENAFALTVVRHQQDRAQDVVDTGPYAIVRHPMYLGALLIFAGAPLLTG